MYSYNIGKMSIIYLDINKKKIQEVYLRPIMNVYYDKITSDRLKNLNNTHTLKSKTNIKISDNNIYEQKSE